MLLIKIAMKKKKKKIKRKKNYKKKSKIKKRYKKKILKKRSFKRKKIRVKIKKSKSFNIEITRTLLKIQSFSLKKLFTYISLPIFEAYYNFQRQRKRRILKAEELRAKQEERKNSVVNNTNGFIALFYKLKKYNETSSSIIKVRSY